MAITDEEAQAWAEEVECATTVAPQSDGGECGEGDGAVRIPATVVVPAGAAETGAALAPAQRRELTVVLTLAPADGENPTWRALYTIGREGGPYPVQHSLVAADPAWASAQIARLIAETEARWAAAPALPKASGGTPVAAPAGPAAAAPAKGAAGTGTATKGRAKAGAKAAAAGGDTGLLAAALLQGAPADAPAPAPKSANGSPHAAATPETPPPAAPPAPQQTRKPKPAPAGQVAMEIFG